MLAANVWHWWIGIALVLLAVISVVALAGSYVAYVRAKRYPSRAQQSHHHTDL